MNGKAGLVLGIVLAVVIGMVVLSPVVSAVNDNTGTVSESENVTQDIGNFTDLGGYEIVSGSSVVTNEAGTTLTEGTDYEIGEQNGSIKFLSTTATTDGNLADVSYDYQATDGPATTVIGFVPVMFGLLLFVAAARGVQRQM